jgi:hypothetical protein
LTIAIALSTSFIAVFIGVFLNNNRLNDVKELLTAKIGESRAQSSREAMELRVLIEKNHSEMLLKLTEVDNRLARLENERRIVQ